MSEAKVETVRALAEAFFPGLHQDAESARNANQEAVATFLETSAANMDFVIAAVSCSTCLEFQYHFINTFRVKPRLRDWGPGSSCIRVRVCLSPRVS